MLSFKISYKAGGWIYNKLVPATIRQSADEIAATAPFIVLVSSFLRINNIRFNNSAAVFTARNSL